MKGMLDTQTSHTYDISLFKVWEVWAGNDNLMRQPHLIIES